MYIEKEYIILFCSAMFFILTYIFFEKIEISELCRYNRAHCNGVNLKYQFSLIFFWSNKFFYLTIVIGLVLFYKWVKYEHI